MQQQRVDAKREDDTTQTAQPVNLTQPQSEQQAQREEQPQRPRQHPSYQRRRFDSASDDTVLQTLDHMQHFLAQAHSSTLGDDGVAAHQAQASSETEHKKASEEKEEEGSERERQVEEEEREADEAGSEEQIELRRMMEELVNRPEVIRWAAGADRMEQEEADEEGAPRVSHKSPSRLLPLAARMREESELLASRRPPLLSSASLAPSVSSSHSSFSLLSAAERRLCSRRLSSLQRQLAVEARQRRTTQHALREGMAEEERRRKLTLQRVQSTAVERAMAAAMGRNRRDERELERMVAAQSDRVRLLLGMKRDGMRQYYREQLGLVQEELERQEVERHTQEKAHAYSHTTAARLRM